MRLRLYEVGHGKGQVHRFEGFPVTLSTTAAGELCVGRREQEHPRCVLDEDRGTIVIENCDEFGEVFLNDLPIEHGGLMPGDSLRLGDRAFLVSYERVTGEAPPACRFRLADP